MPAINSRSERGSVQLAELSLLAAVRGPPNPRSPCQKIERSGLESLFHRRGTGSSNPSFGSLIKSKNTRFSAILGEGRNEFCPQFCPHKEGIKGPGSHDRGCAGRPRLRRQAAVAPGRPQQFTHGTAIGCCCGRSRPFLTRSTYSVTPAVSLLAFCIIRDISRSVSGE
jgi:hypothetical protein